MYALPSGSVRGSPFATLLRAWIQETCCTDAPDAVPAGNPASIAGSTLLLKYPESQSMHQPVKVKVPLVSMYMLKVMFGVRSLEVSVQFCNVSKPDVARLASFTAEVREAVK